MSEITKIEELLPKTFFVVFDNLRKRYFRPHFQRYSGYCFGTWFKEEDAIKEAKYYNIKDYKVTEVSICAIHPDFERIYNLKDKDFNPYEIESMFLSKLKQIIQLQLFKSDLPEQFEQDIL